MIFLSMYTDQLYALQYPLPVFNDIKSGYENGNFWVIPGTPTLIEGGSWGVGWPTYNYAQLMIKTVPDNQWRPLGGHISRKKPNETRSQLLMRVNKLNENLGVSGLYLVKSIVKFDPSNACYGLFNTNSSTNLLVDAHHCSYVPPVLAQCNITTSEILLDHKTISTKEMNNSRVESSFTLNCSRSGTVKFSLNNGSDSIALGEGISKIEINNLPLKSNIKVESGNNVLKIESTLKGVTSGSWQGSSVLVFEPI